MTITINSRLVSDLAHDLLAELLLRRCRHFLQRVGLILRIQLPLKQNPSKDSTLGFRQDHVAIGPGTERCIRLSRPLSLPVPCELWKTMLRKIVLLAFLAAPWLEAHPAMASADISCSTKWTLTQRELIDCYDLPFLSPGNDSRVNLQLLLIDAGRASVQAPALSELQVQPPYASTAPFISLGQLFAVIRPRGPQAEVDGTGSDLASGEGSRCRSNATGTRDFDAALSDSSALPDTERDALQRARRDLSPTCDDTTKPVPFETPATIHSALGLQFADYLAGATAFYQGDYDVAGKRFAGLRSSDQPWLKEASRYMVGRVELNRAQLHAFDAFGILTRNTVDAAALNAAETGFRAYLADYPKGLYSVSARGLLRRIDWLGDQPQKLADEYAWQFADMDPARDQVSETDLVEEADSKLLTQVGPGDIREPMLLATLDLMGMRRSSQNAAPREGQELQAQKPVFAGKPELYEYLLAAHALYVESDPVGALAHLPTSPPTMPMSYLEFSRQVLRGLALEAKKDWAGARQQWLALTPLARQPFQRPALDLALAMNYERHNGMANVFTVGSPIHDANVREILLRNVAGPQLLIERVKAGDASGRERRVALFVLLYKDLTRGHYTAFADDVTLSAPGAPDPADAENLLGAEPDAALFRWPGAHDDGKYACPPLRHVAQALARDPRQPRSLICLGEFVRLNGLDGYPLDTQPPPEELGGAASQFTGALFSRLEAYKLIISNTAAPPGDKAYALYRAINCYAPVGTNDCGGKDVPESQRKQWFRTLKTVYAASEWAKALKFYW
jgi:hypothetical protein